MKKISRTYLLVISLIFSSLIHVNAKQAEAGAICFPVDSTTVLSDTLSIVSDQDSKKEQREKKREQRRIELKESHSRLFIHGAYVFAKFDTKVTFSPPESIFRAVISLEDNLGLPENASFFSGSAIYRFTPTSGLYLNYYGLNRSKDSYTKQDIYWKGDTIPAGTKSVTYFKTHVFSAGYILSILKGPDSFLGTYLNLYFMPLSLGVKTDISHKDYNENTFVPLPNIGVLANFKLTKWLSVSGNVGFFSLYTKTLGGYIQDLNIYFPIRVTRWLNFSLNYQSFIVHTVFPEEEIDTYVDYNFHGPAVGVTLKF